MTRRWLHLLLHVGCIILLIFQALHIEQLRKAIVEEKVQDELHYQGWRFWHDQEMREAAYDCWASTHALK